MTPATGRVREIRLDEVEAWCACPVGEDDPRLADWVSGERAWLARWHHGPGNLFAYESQGRFLGKYDVPQETPGKWTLWAPSASGGEGVETVLDALCAHVREEAARRGVRAVEVFVEEAHRQREHVVGSLQRTGFRLHEERVIVTRDLADGLEATTGTGLTFCNAADLAEPELRRLCERAGAPAERLPGASGVVALQDGEPVGIALRRSAPGDEPVTLQYLGLVPEARGRGHGRALLLTVLHGARDAGAVRYVGSTGVTNAAMRGVFERIGCRVVGSRHVYVGHP
jgi:ribosomal protein S18 acetylase RimI-like enzyme